MIRTLLTSVMILTATQSAALSCMAPSVTDSYRQAADAEEMYVVLNGTFTFPRPPRSETGNPNAPREVSYVATFEGQALTASGFRNTAPKRVTVTHSCLAAWCGQLTPIVETLAFVEQRSDGLFLSVGPCGGQAFAQPTRQMVNQVETCLQGSACGG